MRSMGMFLFTLLISAAGCTEDAGNDTGEGQSPQTQAVCGGLAGAACSDGLVCVDDPSDTCDPEHAGADCLGLCAEPADAPPSCGGFAGAACPDGLVCVDDPSDMCDPALGGADCLGLCVEPPDMPQSCGGFAGFPCPDGLVCVDDPRDDCAPPQGADCGGICVGP